MKKMESDPKTKATNEKKAVASKSAAGHSASGHSASGKEPGKTTKAKKK